MSLNRIDKSQALRTEDELRALVEAIHESPQTIQETNWLEWKSSLDLGAAEGRFAVAKTILGFANRSVDQALLALEGTAYMVVGVEPGAAPGVPAFDHASLGQRIKTYADGPRWTPHYIEFSGVTVLVIVIEPPRAGDPMHTLQKEFSNSKTRHQAGAVFHRGVAHTEPAGPKEILMLGERLLQGVRQPDLELALCSISDPLTRLDPRHVEDWLNRHERHVRAKSGAPSPPPPQTPHSSLFGDLPGTSAWFSSVENSFRYGLYNSTEDRQEFDRRVEEYLDGLRQGSLVDNIVRNIVRSDKNKVYFLAGNLTDEPISGVQLTVVIPKTKLRVFTHPPVAERLSPLPKWPDAVRDNLRANWRAPALSHPYDFDPGAGSVVDSGETYEVTWNVGNLRPGEWSNDLEISIIAGPAAPDEIEVEMIARAMDRRRTTTEQVTITIGPNRWSVDDWFSAGESEVS